MISATANRHIQVVLIGTEPLKEQLILGEQRERIQQAVDSCIGRLEEMLDKEDPLQEECNTWSSYFHYNTLSTEAERIHAAAGLSWLWTQQLSFHPRYDVIAFAEREIRPLLLSLLPRGVDVEKFNEQIERLAETAFCDHIERDLFTDYQQEVGTLLEKEAHKVGERLTLQRQQIEQEQQEIYTQLESASRALLSAQESSAHKIQCVITHLKNILQQAQLSAQKISALYQEDLERLEQFLRTHT